MLFVQNAASPNILSGIGARDTGVREAGARGWRASFAPSAYLHIAYPKIQRKYIRNQIVL